jgi:crotonobetainyl-CoA:carnitine CoA-transferase CaiB-like acyl-CoA transferase
MQPYSEIDVLDFTQTIAGPVCAQSLSLLGANVVKVEPPSGDAFRPTLEGSGFTMCNLGGKRSLSLDLKTDDGQAIARDLAEQADVILASFRPGVLERFGLDYESVRERNPEVVFCAVTGYGLDGPYNEFPAYDPIIQAVSGLMSVIGYEDRPPARIGSSVIDFATGANAACMVSAALSMPPEERGNHIDISLFDVAVSWMGYRIAKYTDSGEIPKRAGSGLHGVEPNGVFYAGDDEPFYVLTLTDRQWERFCRAIDREDLLEREAFESNRSRWDHRDELLAELDDAFAAFDRDELVDVLVDAGVPAGRQQDIVELVDDPQADARDLLVEAYNLETESDVKVARLPLRTTEWLPDVGGRPPRIGEHSREILAEYGVSDGEITDLIDAGVVHESVE